MTKTRKLRELINGTQTIISPCAYDALSARLIQQAGFQMMGTTGYGMHGTMLGTPDNGLLAFNEMVDMCSKIAAAVELPVLADAEGGYGNAINTYRTVKEFERAGLAGLFIEDQQLPPSCPFLKTPELISIEEMCGKIRAAIDARTDSDFVIVARTDAPFDEAIMRAAAYQEAGADMIKIVPKTKQELIDLPQQVKLPLHLGFVPGKEINMGLTANDAAKMGYRIITFPMTALFSNLCGVSRSLQYLKEHKTDEGFEAMATFDDYLQVVDAEKYRQMDAKYLLQQ